MCLNELQSAQCLHPRSHGEPSCFSTTQQDFSELLSIANSDSGIYVELEIRKASAEDSMNQEILYCIELQVISWSYMIASAAGAKYVAGPKWLPKSIDRVMQEQYIHSTSASE